MKSIAYRTDRFEGFVNDSIARNSGWWTYYRAHLKESSGGTLRVGGYYAPDSFNIIRAVLAGSENILNNFYESLLKKGPQGNDLNWLIDSCTRETSDDDPAIPAGHERFTIDLVSGLNWSDGTSLTAYDVVFSLNTIAINTTAESHFYAPYGLDNVTSIQALHSQQFVIEFNCESYWHLSDFGYIPIFPSHIFGSYNASELLDYDPVPPDDNLTTSGPFIIDQYTRNEQLTILRRENYHFLPDETSTEMSTTSTEDSTTPNNTLLNGTILALGGGIGVIVVVMVLVKMKKST
ncbi:MAG: hypothetical protein KAQ65_02875 [Candidatus Thorarchaeota archaeon]|nr:hypothetical protein [Candidatus Thorarchaeota archaeon]